MFASAIVSALVLVDAESARLIDLEAPRTDTPEAAESIDAGARFGTGSRLVALVYVWKNVKLNNSR